ncbi:hypothetical protein QQG55_41645 [Brugia pahangi]
MVKIGIPKEILQPEKLKAGRDIMSMTQEKNVTEQHKKSSSLSQMITVKNICGLSTERHKQEIYKAKMCMTKTEDQCCISNQLVKQRTNDRFGANFETNRRVPGVYRKTGIVLAKETAAAARVIDYQWRETARKEVYYTQGIQIEWLLKDASSQFQEGEMEKPKMIVLQREK